MAADPRVSYVSAGDVINAPTPEISLAHVTARSRPDAVLRSRNLHKHGNGIVIGVIHVQGFYFMHPDFLDAEGKTRFVRIWDQGGGTAGSREGRERHRESRTPDAAALYPSRSR